MCEAPAAVELLEGGECGFRDGLESELTGGKQMPSRYIGKKRDTGSDAEVPAELSQREAQDRAKGERGQARSPVDAQHVEAPKRQDNARGHREGNRG